MICQAELLTDRKIQGIQQLKGIRLEEIEKNGHISGKEKNTCSEASLEIWSWNSEQAHGGFPVSSNLITSLLNSKNNLRTMVKTQSLLVGKLHRTASLFRQGNQEVERTFR